MLHVFRKQIVKSLVLGVGLFCLSAFFMSGPAQAEVLWQFNVPVNLKNMPKSVEHVQVHWTLYADGFVELADDVVEISLDASHLQWKSHNLFYLPSLCFLISLFLLRSPFHSRNDQFCCCDLCRGNPKTC